MLLEKHSGEGELRADMAEEEWGSGNKQQLQILLTDFKDGFSSGFS